jgi:hypothetical protein
MIRRIANPILMALNGSFQPDGKEGPEVYEAAQGWFAAQNNP